MKKIFLITFLQMFLMIHFSYAADISAKEILDKSFDAWRGTNSSYAEMTMKIVRPDRNETLTLKSWTKGDDLAMSKFIAPAKFKGQGVLVNKDAMWTYSEKSGRSIKISSSLKSKSWMGSDVSYDDISKSKDVINMYTHTLLETKVIDGKNYYIIESIPFKDAAIVWGKEVAAINTTDFVMKWREFYDQEGKLVKRFDVLEVKVIGGKPMIQHMKITNLEKEGYYTEFLTNNSELNKEIPDSFFSLSNLEKP